ncbi:hypothetical protein [Acetivibrio cellulolyticus]|uniref:hypothetical protein n=1 Tax=Acetivibrio cellulolyticus TaxID=35830 RepID=UPI0001E2F5C3|nr:hypothetical protein [Acetivibrio cellulolyticus]
MSRAQRNQVNSWAATLDNYNNGLIGPGHCSESGTSVEPELPEVDEQVTCDNGGININISDSSYVKIFINENKEYDS